MDERTQIVRAIYRAVVRLGGLTMMTVGAIMRAQAILSVPLVPGVIRYCSDSRLQDGKRKDSLGSTYCTEAQQRRASNGTIVLVIGAPLYLLHRRDSE